MAPPEITFRGLVRSDFRALQLWLNTPHVYEWWGRRMGIGALGGDGEDAATESQVELKYGPDCDNGGPTHRYVIEFDGVEVGLIQWYPLGAFPDYARAIGEDPADSAGIDFFIGDPASLGRGLGTRAIEGFITAIVFRTTAVRRVVAGPAEGNIRSIRTLESAGFRPVRHVIVAGEAERVTVMVRLKESGPDCP